MPDEAGEVGEVGRLRNQPTNASIAFCRRQNVAPMAIAEYPIHTTFGVRTPKVKTSAITVVRIYFVMLFLVGLGAFVFGVENRLSADGLFNLPPAVNWVPPLSAQDWWAAFTLHQQDPTFAACGGTESLSEFKALYWFEWLRRLSVLAVVTVATVGLFCAGVMRTYRFALPPLVSLVAVAFVFWTGRILVEDTIAHIEILKDFDVGQYRHAADVSFASVLVALVLAFAVAPPVARDTTRSRRRDRLEWLWLALVVLNICFGAFFAARDATAVWTTWPGYNGHVLPPVDELLTYTPIGLNFTFNQYMIQLVHRVLSIGLWSAALWQFVAMIGRGFAANVVAVRFLLMTVQMATGIATLILGVPPVLSLVHQLGPIALLASSFVILIVGEEERERSEARRSGSMAEIPA
jgi:heme a synthase